MEAKEIERTDLMILDKDKFHEMLEEGSWFSPYKSIITYDQLTAPRSEYADSIRRLAGNEIAVICHFRLNGRPETKFDILVMKLCGYWGVDFEALKRHTRIRKVLEKRQILHYLIWKCSYEGIIERLSLAEIGYKTGMFDHATVKHSIKVVSGLYEIDKYYKKELDLILSFLKINDYVKV